MNKIAKTEVYSWRLSTDLKMRLEAAARDEKSSVGAVLEQVVREWLKRRKPSDEEEGEQQRRLHKRAQRAIGTVSIEVPSATNEEVRKVMGEYLEEKYRASQRRAPRRSD